MFRDWRSHRFLEITELGEAPTPLRLTAEEIEALADELAKYHVEFTDLC